MDTTFENQTFEKVWELEKGVYDACIFEECRLAYADLSDFLFLDCTFSGCDLSMATIDNVGFRDVRFIECKMLGLNFKYCNPFLQEFYFEKCQLDMAIFQKQKMRGTKFKTCSLREIDFSEADLAKAIFDDCDMDLATFDNTILEEADLSTAYNIVLDPEQNYIQSAHFSKTSLEGLLMKYRLNIVD